MLVILHVPAFVYGVLDIDESDLVVIGRLLGHGAIPYVDFVEKKPILLYLFYWPAAVFGFEIWPMQILGLLWLFATCLVVGSAAHRWTGRREAGVAAAWLCGLASSCNVLSINAELLLNLPAAGALWFFVRAEKGGGWRAELGVGLCVGLATLFKHQAGILLFSLGLAHLWLWVRQRSARWDRLGALGAGFVVPWVLVGGVYAALGHWDAFFEWNVRRNLLYSSFGAGSAWLRFALGLGLYVIFSAPLAWFLAARQTWRATTEPIRLALALTLWATWIPVSLGGRFYAHYYLQFVPALALLAAPAAVDLVDRWPRLRRRIRVGVWLALLIPVVGYLAYGTARGVVGRYPTQDAATIELGRWLRTRTSPQSRLFVWGHYTPIYYLAQRLPGTRYYNTSVQMGDFDPGHLPEGFDFAPYRSERDVSLAIEDLERRRPEYFVDTSPARIHSWHKVPLSQFPRLERYLRAHYRLVARPGGAAVYRRRRGPLQRGSPRGPG